MPVQRAEDVLNGFVAEYLDKKVPEDQIATYSVAAVTHEFEACDEHDSQRQTAVVWQVHIYLAPIERAEGGPVPFRMNALLPYDFLDDGDTVPLEQTLDKMWDDHTFVTMIHGVDSELERAAREPEED